MAPQVRVMTMAGSVKGVLLTVLVGTQRGVERSLSPVGLAVVEELRSLLAEMPAASGVVVGVAGKTRQLAVLTEPHWAPNASRWTAAAVALTD
jgi:hypothetical protein